MTATSPPAASAASAKETILVVDDEASIRRILETRLSMIGYQVITACDGLEAIEAFRRTSPDLVVLDVMMPKLDGYGVCQELRKESDVPIVMLTALGDVADRITGLELGADDYVVKPFSPKELEARIRCVLRRVDKDSVAGIPNSGVIQVGELRIDTNKRQVYRARSASGSPGWSSACWNFWWAAAVNPSAAARSSRRCGATRRSGMWTPGWWMFISPACAPNWRTIRPTLS